MDVHCSQTVRIVIRKGKVNQIGILMNVESLKMEEVSKLYRCPESQYGDFIFETTVGFIKLRI
jgi:hypothetical protein